MREKQGTLAQGGTGNGSVRAFSRKDTLIKFAKFRGCGARAGARRNVSARNAKKCPHFMTTFRIKPQTQGKIRDGAPN